MELQQGTYVREPDGAMLLYHSELTTWNAPVIALQNHLACKADGTTRLDEWRRVTDTEEIRQLHEYLEDELEPGEYVEIKP